MFILFYQNKRTADYVFSDLMDKDQANPYLFKYSMYEYQTLESYILNNFFIQNKLCRYKKGNI